MIIIPKQVRPIHILHNGRWRTARKRIALKEPFTVEVEGFFYAKCIDLSKLVGVAAYLYKTKSGKLHVFDFSASHLCPNQLERIRQAYANVS